MTEMHFSTTTLIGIAIILGLLVVPRALQRFRIPSQLTCFLFGVFIFYEPLVTNHVIAVLATFGIASLFLLAGIEVDLVEIRRQLPRLTAYLGIRAVILGVIAWLAVRYIQMPWPAGVLFGLGILTPSTGFILDTLPGSGLQLEEQSEVTIDAIAGEIVALAVLFLDTQASSLGTLALSSLILILLIVVTPFFFLFLGKFVVPYAPGSEFSLLLLVGIVCAVITQNIGVHYLIGAFVAGLVASMLRTRMATLASHENLHAVRLFASFFIPFYFFHEGLKVPSDALVLPALLWGIGLCVVAIPIRIGKNWLQARYVWHVSARGALRISMALTPTLIFTLVIAEILRDTFHISDALYGGLLIYACVTTILPALVLPGLKETDAGTALENPA
jgi:Kef-type K+ transport system membrane component KefB